MNASNSDGERQEEVGRLRAPAARWPRLAQRALLVVVAASCLVNAVDVPTYLNLTFFREQMFGLIYGLVFAAGFIVYPAHRRAPRTTVPWYDLVGAAAGLAAGLYLLVFWPKIVLSPGELTADKVVMGAVAVALILEVTRRIFGWPLVILTGVFILYAHYSYLVPGDLGGRGYSWQRIFAFLYTDTGGLLGFIAVVVFGMVFSFLLFGRILFATGGADFFARFSMALMGGRRGGPAKVSVIASSLFGTMSGSASSNVVITGSITIPMMKQMGYRSSTAAAVEAVASSGGCLMPPIMGATAFVMAEILSISYTEVVTAALLPALLYYLALFMQIDLEAAKVGHRGLPREQLPRLGEVLLGGWVFIVPLAVLVICLFVLFISPTKSALLATLTLLAVAACNARSRIGWRDLVESLSGTGQLVIELGIIGAVAGLIVGVIALTGLGLQFSQTLIAVSGGNTLLLLALTALASIVLGMGMPVTASYIILAVLAAPALVMTGVSPIAAHLFIFYFALLSFITPPVCVAVYIASTLAGSKPMETAGQAMKLGFVAFLVPFMFVADEALLLEGSLGDIAIASLAAVLGIAVLAVAFQGYWRRPLAWGLRLLLVAGGLLLVTHLWHYRLAGLVVVVGLLAWLLRDGRPAPAAVPSVGAAPAAAASDPGTITREPRSAS